jgi:hypothetical protein
MPDKKTGLRGTQSQAKTRVLLALWDLGADKTEVKRGDLTEKIKRTGEMATDYQPIIEELEQAGAIAISKKNQIFLPDEGLKLLDAALIGSEFQFDAQIGAKTANALLRWISERATLASGATAAADNKGGDALASYDEFKSVALEVYDKLNRDYNLDNLVPIYRMRREIGERVTRSQFNEWMMEMQTNDIFQLIGGEMPGITPEQVEDSIKTKIGGVRYYAKRL